MRHLYRIYHAIPMSKRVAFVARLNDLAERSRLFPSFGSLFFGLAGAK